MATITISPAWQDRDGTGGQQFPDVLRGKGFITNYNYGGSQTANTFTIVVTGVPDPDTGETITSVTIEPLTFDLEDEPDLAIANSTISVPDEATFSGRYLNRFEDNLKYLNPGKSYCNGQFTTSELVEEPTEIVGFGNLPANTNLFYVDGDTSTLVTEQFEVVVSTTGIYGANNWVFTLDHDIYNDWEFYIIRISEHRKTFVGYNANNFTYANSEMESTYSGYLY
jgi:hypothetical protein